MSAFFKALLWTAIPILAVISILGLAMFINMGRTLRVLLVSFAPITVAFVVGIILVKGGKMGDFRKGLFWTTIPFSIILLTLGVIIPMIPGLLRLVGIRYIDFGRLYWLIYDLPFVSAYIVAITVVPAGLIAAIVFLLLGKKKLAAGIFWGSGINIVVVGLTFFVSPFKLA